MDLDLVVPIDLRKKDVPAILIYGDGEEKLLTKILWGLVAGQDIRFVTPKSEEELMLEAFQSAIIFINVHSIDDPSIEFASKLSQQQGVVTDVIAITKEPDIRNRLHIMSHEFDAIYNQEILDLPEFQRVFLQKLRKGMVRLNNRLQEEEYKTFQAYLSASADAFIVFDKDKRIFFVSDHYLKVYPKSAEFFVRGMPVQRAFEAVADEMGIPKEDPRYIEAKDFWVGLKGSLVFRLDNGKILRMMAKPMQMGEGTIISTTDITDYILATEALAQKQQELEQALANEQEASNLQKQFINMVSHEFRTPLTIVDGNAQMIERRLDKMEPSEISKRLKTIRSAVSRLINMMEAVLSSNMLRSGKLDLYLEPINLKDLIQELSEEQEDLSKKHKIILNLDGLPDLVVLDRKVMVLILTNLISNAVKFTSENPQILVEALVNRDQELILSVADNGVGIPEQELPLIFDRFYRATTSNGIAGSGVGLSLVLDLVQLMNGTIQVQSAIGKGTRFEIRCPIGESKEKKD
jgi:signal transduction histidine kinase